MVEHGAAQIGITKCGSREVSTTEIRTDCTDGAQIGLSKIGSSQITSGQILPAQILTTHFSCCI